MEAAKATRLRVKPAMTAKGSTSEIEGCAATSEAEAAESCDYLKGLPPCVTSRRGSRRLTGEKCSGEFFLCYFLFCGKKESKSGKKESRSQNCQAYSNIILFVLRSSPKAASGLILISDLSLLLRFHSLLFRFHPLELRFHSLHLRFESLILRFHFLSLMSY